MRITTLDSLRGIFSIMIVVLHSPVSFHFVNAPFVRNSFFFVDYFFVLSGFVISLAYVGKLTKLSSIVDFMILRIGRIWPLHAMIALAFLTFVFVKSMLVQTGLFGGNPTPVDADMLAQTARDMFFLNAFVNDSWLTLNFPAWSINAEFWAYVVFAALCLLPFPYWLCAAAVVIVCISVLVNLLHPSFGANFGWAPFRATFLFFSGYFAFRVYTMVKELPLPFPTLIEATLIASIAGVLMHSTTTSDFTFILDALFTVSIVIFALQRGFISKVLQARFFQTVGLRSYSIYITHIFLFAILGTLLGAVERQSGFSLHQTGLVGDREHVLIFFGSIWFMDLYLLAQVALVVWIAGYSYRYIELPGQALAKRIVGR